MLSKSNPIDTGNKYFDIVPASARETKNTLFILLAVISSCLLFVYLNPLEPFFNKVLGIESVNGCPLLTFTNIPCPFCGMGRVFSCMTDLYIAQSFHYNPLGLLFYIIAGFIFAAITVITLRKKKIVLKKDGQKLWYLPVLFIVLMWILNILYGHHH